METKRTECSQKPLLSPATTLYLGAASNPALNVTPPALERGPQGICSRKTLNPLRENSRLGA